MQNIGFAIAGVLALVTFAVHTFVGQIYVVRPLLAVPNLTRASRWLAFFCWHMVTVLLITMAGTFAYAAYAPEGRVLGMLFTAMAAVFSALCVAVAIMGGIRPYRLPPAGLFALTAGAGAWGCWA